MRKIKRLKEKEKGGGARKCVDRGHGVRSEGGYCFNGFIKCVYLHCHTAINDVTKPGFFRLHWKELKVI